jgi:hypothetical protein
MNKRLLLAFGIATPLAAPINSLAHHGFTGEYDYRRPVFMEGRITKVDYGYPHARISFVLADWKPPASSLLTEVDKAEGRDTSKLVAAPRALKTGQAASVIFDPLMTRQLADAGKAAPQVGQTLITVAYERISRDRDSGELRGLHLRLPDGAWLLGQRRSYHVEK